MDAHGASTPHTSTEPPAEQTRDRSGELPDALNGLLADIFAIYIKTKSFHWHMSGSHFRDYHLLLDEQASQIFAMTDVIAERVRKIGSTTVRSVGYIARLQSIRDNDADLVAPADMLAELRSDNQAMVRKMVQAHALCERHADIASASVLETYIDEGERRVWFLRETAEPEAPDIITAL